MSKIMEENCPNCLVNSGQAVIMQAVASEEEYGFVWQCPRCGERFTEEELKEIYDQKE